MAALVAAMIRLTPPASTPTRRNPLRLWVCVFCDAHGRAQSEAHQRQLTREHLATCREAKRYHDRMARARAAMEATR